MGQGTVGMGLTVRGEAVLSQGQAPQHPPGGLHFAVQNPEDVAGRGARLAPEHKRGIHSCRAGSKGRTTSLLGTMCGKVGPASGAVNVLRQGSLQG
jgi:hypothetical protein